MRRLVLLTSMAMLAAACTSGGTGTAPPASAAVASAAASGGPEILPLIISSELTKGPTRFLFSVTDRANKLIAASNGGWR